MKGAAWGAIGACAARPEAATAAWERLLQETVLVQPGSDTALAVAIAHYDMAYQLNEIEVPEWWSWTPGDVGTSERVGPEDVGRRKSDTGSEWKPRSGVPGKRCKLPLGNATCGSQLDAAAECSMWDDACVARC